MGRLNVEALREEEHRFDENNHTRTSAIRQRLCLHCSYAPAATIGGTGGGPPLILSAAMLLPWNFQPL
ncbi:hypothetical protein K6M90_09940 [Rhizobium sp. 9T]|uniref:hypothetical protein n=1 Tax=Rhizobium croatiense TaxID=2867516 RepID=UPI001C93626A|nr:hypothetical protein [Rhizobium croatiense]MBY4607971.1 hypothetical protein [Rhizobium croatiense]